MIESRELIAVVGPDRPEATALVRAIEAGGWAVERAADRVELGTRSVRPVLVCFCPDGVSSLDAPRLAELRVDAKGNAVPLVLCVGLQELGEAGRLFELGADDVWRVDADAGELCGRLRARLREIQRAAELERHRRGTEIVLELAQALSSTLHIRSILSLVVARVADLVRFDRVSIVLTAAGDERGFVLVTSDDRQLRDLPIRIADYPEIEAVLESGRPLVIADSVSHPLFEVDHLDVPKRFRSLILVPILFEQRPMGVLFLRNELPSSLAEADVTLLRALAHATGVALRNARLVQSLRDETRRSRNAQAEAQRRVRSLERYADLFDSSADGIVVLDPSGQILFCNPAACRILERDGDELARGPFEAVLDAAEATRFSSLRESFRRGVFPGHVDFRLALPAGGDRIVSLTFNTLIREGGNVIVSLRDVTAERELARELAGTKEFLQRVIDSSVDAIISADLLGRVLLFNPAAERMYGYRAAEVVDRMNVRELYPPGEAENVMRAIRTGQGGEAGRLQSHRTELRAADGSFVPVLLSAALIVQHGRPVGSVGVFTDLRARLQIEERLARAQQELAAQERKAVVAELAGATAHELNQPLTAIMGYAELVSRKLEEGSPLVGATGAILRETERMAEIVRKIGRLTKYETKPYVGEAKIIDIDRAVDSTPGRPVR